MLTPKIKMQIMQHAKEVYPHECAGLVTQKSRVQKYHRLDNVSQDPENESMPDETQYALASLEGEPIAFVHSHTGDGATTVPSATDLCFCDESGLSWVIVSIPEGDMRIIEPKRRPLIGRPWALGAYDCYGLVMDFHKRHGVTLTDRRLPFEWWKPEYKEDLYRDYWREDGFIENTGDPEVGDMIIFQLQAEKWNHAGIYVGNNNILHHAFGKLSRRDIYSGWYEQHKVLICRHKDLKHGITYKDD
nr:MAG: protein of unknown function DUF1175 [Bacteriophage sp.]